MNGAHLLRILRHRFTRVTSSVAYIPQIDGLRSLALMLVVGHHVFALYLQTTHRLGTQSLPRDWSLIAQRSALVNWGLHLTFGVPIFFVISGFVLAVPFARTVLQTGSLPSTALYLLRRLIRLEPPYFINMTFLFLWIVIWFHQPWWYSNVMIKIFGPHYFASLAYLHAQIFKQPSWISGIAWTLEIEIQFYLLMPVVAQLFRYRRNTVRRCILALLTVAAGLFGQYGLPHLDNPRISLSILGNLQFFLAGVLLADLFTDLPTIFRLSPRIADLCAAVCTGIAIYVLHWSPALTWALPLVVAAFFLGVFRGALASRLFALRCLTIPGTMCYTIYLYHYFLIERCVPWSSRLVPGTHALWLDTMVQFALILPVILLASAILYLSTERPFILLSHWATRRWRALPVSGNAATGLGV